MCECMYAHRDWYNKDNYLNFLFEGKVSNLSKFGPFSNFNH